MLDIFLLFKEGFTEEKLKECIKRTFNKTGTLPINYDCGTAPPNFTIYKKEVQNGIMSVVPEGTLDLTQITEEIEGPAQNQMEEIDALEWSILEFYANNNDILEDDNEDDDDEFEEYEGLEWRFSFSTISLISILCFISFVFSL